MIRILLADGRRLSREGIRLLLEKHQGLQVVAEASDAHTVPCLLEALSVQAVILNMTPPAHAGLEILRKIKKASPDTRIVVLMLAMSELVPQLLEAGASACLTNDCAGAELVAAIRHVMDKGVYLSSSLVERVVRQHVRPSISPVKGSRLAPRERHILCLIAAGRTTKEIAMHLAISGKTVETHRRRIMEKLDRHSIAALTKFAVLEGLSPLETSG